MACETGYVISHHGLCRRQHIAGAGDETGSRVSGGAGGCTTDALVEPVILDYRRQLTKATPLPWTRPIDTVEAGLCHTLTGGIWGGFLLPRSAHYQLPEPLVVEVKGGFCRRHHKSTLVFTATPSGTYSP